MKKQPFFFAFFFTFP
ncbi:pheA operon leader peptide PheL [Erwinia amylovora]|nr:pheA operon leader peptide PheL [Pantoea sp. BAV 3049]